MTGTATGANGAGVDVQQVGGGAVTITAASATGSTSGIYLNNVGFGPGAIVSSGTLSGTAAAGITAIDTPSGGSLTINATTVTGGARGINAPHLGGGALLITDFGQVTGGSGEGVFATTTATSLTLNVSGVSGRGLAAIYARNTGTGVSAVTATGAVSDATGYGIEAVNTFGATGPTTINAAQVTGVKDGIHVYNQGRGALSITATGLATGSSAGPDGILGLNAPAGTALTINAAGGSGGKYGILAKNYGTGATSVTSTGQSPARRRTDYS